MNQFSRINRSFASLLAAAGVGVPMVLPLPAVGQTTAQRALPLPNSGKATPLVDAPTLVTTYGIDEDLARQVAADLVARADLGFSTDPQLVIDLRTGKQNMSPEIPEVAMTLTEADEFFVRQSLVDDAQILDERLRSGPLASVYGGQFIDHANGVLVIQAVAGTGVEKVQAALAGDVGRSLPHRDRIEVRQVEVSNRELVAAREVVIARAEAKGVDSGLTGAIIRNSTNELVVFLAPDSSAQQRSDWNTALQKLGVPHRIEERRELVPVDGTLRSDSQVPPFLGGHGYAATSSTKNPPPSGTFYRGCTLGFKANRNSAPGSSFMLSAGHCWYNAQNPTYYAPIDAKAYYNWDNQNGGTRTGLGNLKGYWATENFDFSLIAVSNSAPKIIVNAAPTNYYRGITAVTSYAPEGTFVCQIGATSDAAHCGDVTDWDNGNHHIETDIDGVIGGDSGGPLYLPQANNKAWATGVTRTSNGTATESSNIYRYLHTFCSDCNVDVE